MSVFSRRTQPANFTFLYSLLEQGVGETLRGTLNNEIDSRWSRHDPDKAAAVNAKNQATLEAGQREMAGLRAQRGLGTTVSTDRDKNLPDLPHQPNYTYHPNAPRQNYSALPAMKNGKGYIAPHGTAIRPDHDYGDYDGPTQDLRGMKSYESAATYETAPGSVDYSDSRSSEGSRRGIRKLIKRKPADV